jgi:hypothetical protein
MTSASDRTPQAPQNRDTAALDRVPFAAECHRQAKSLNNDQNERDILAWLEAAADTSHWT